MKRKLLTLPIALLTFLSVFCFSAFIVDDDPFAALLKKLEEFIAKNPQEKVYLHLDKPYYAIGDNIWFKAYVIDAKTSAPSMLSGILYVELINEKDSIKSQLKLPMQSGITWSDFKLSDSLTEGNYRIRAYTQWMRNAGPAFFFDKTIKIGNSWANKVFTKVTNEYNTENNNQKVNSTIQFADKAGKYYANAEVTYEVQLSNRNLSKGKSVTNANGEIMIPILNTQPNLYKSGKIIARITLPNKQIVEKNIPIKTTSTATDVQFFPEGGRLVEGLPCRVGVKAVNSNGLGETVSAIITDNDGTELSRFETSYLGMGSFVLNPLPGKTYTAKVKFANGTETKLTLPKIEQSGYVIAVNNTDSTKMSIKVMLTPDLMNKGDLRLVAQHNGAVYFVTKVPTSKQLVSVVAPKVDFPSGIVQLTLFNPENLPVSERIAFVDNIADKIDLKLENLKSAYGKRGKVDLSFLTTNNAKPTRGSFSIAVTNSSVVTPDLDNESNIYTSLLLTSDLIGYVEKPNRYFLSNDKKAKANLDLLMLTQGWRKIEWNKIAASQFPIIAYQPEKTIKISGTITKGGKPVANGKVSLFSNSGGFFATDTLSDANGRFSFNDIVFGDNVKFLVQARTDKNNKNVQIDLDIIPGQVVTANKNTGDIEVNVNETLKNYLQQSDEYFNEQVKRGFLSQTILLKEVKIVGEKNRAPNSSNLNGAGRADAIFTEKEMENSYSLSQFLQGRVAGLMIVGGRPVLMRAGGRGAMAINLDGISMGNEFMLDDINVNDVESVEVLKSIGNTAIYGGAGSNGVLVITTKKGGRTSDFNRYTPGIVTYAPKGYYQGRLFYSPKYDVTPDNKPDLRSTVYWNPHLTSDPTGKASFSYFNTDEQGTYRIVMEGIDSGGNIVHNVYTYQVN
jgi:hypothetical protein